MRQFDAKNCGLDFVKLLCALHNLTYRSLGRMAQALSSFANVGSEVGNAPASPYAPKFLLG